MALLCHADRSDDSAAGCGGFFVNRYLFYVVIAIYVLMVIYASGAGRHQLCGAVESASDDSHPETVQAREA